MFEMLIIMSLFVVTEIVTAKKAFKNADDIMCESCKDAIATQIIGRGLGEQEVCTDCYYEIGDRGY